MQRRVEITVPPEQADSVFQEIRGTEGLLSLRVQRGTAEHPGGSDHG